MSETEQWWLVHWTGGDQGYVPMSESDLVEHVADECVALVDLCEQEILGGNYRDDEHPERDDVMAVEVALLRSRVMNQLYQAFAQGGGSVELYPWYAVAQREAYSIQIKSKSDEGASA